MKAQPVSFNVTADAGDVDGLLMMPPDAHAFYVFAHGAGAGMHHAFMATMAERLAQEGIATLRYNFPYIQQKRKRIDSPPVLLATVRAAVAEGARYANTLPLFAGGKSMGGRMTSMAQAAEPLEGVRGLIFFGFPLHPPGKPSTERAEHLSNVKIPMLFLQGTKDEFAEMSLLVPVIKKLNKTATLHLIEHADHSFRVPKRSGASTDDVMKHLAAVVRGFVDRGVP